MNNNLNSNYSLVRKSTGSHVRYAATRALARSIKKARDFKLSILNLKTGMIIR